MSQALLPDREKKPERVQDWTNLELKLDLKEGRDYVLVSSLIW